MAASFPTGIKTFVAKVDLTDTLFAAHINALQEEVAAIEATLGTDPHGAYASVKARIAAAEAAGIPKYTTVARDALTGVAADTVILNTTTDQFERWDGDSWEPLALDPTVLVKLTDNLEVNLAASGAGVMVHGDFPLGYTHYWIGTGITNPPSGWGGGGTVETWNYGDMSRTHQVLTDDSNPPKRWVRRHLTSTTWTPWSNATSELAYAEVTSNQVGIGTTMTDATGLTITPTVPATPIRVNVELGLSKDATAATVQAQIRDETGAVTPMIRNRPMNASADDVLTFSARLTPGAGARTYKVQLRALSGAVTLAANAQFPSFIQAERV